MFFIKALLALLLALLAGLFLQAEEESLDTVLHDIFDNARKRSLKYRPCGIEKECLPRHLCQDGKLNRHKPQIDMRTGENDDGCPFLSVCCDVRKEEKPIPLPFTDVSQPTLNMLPSIPIVTPEETVGCGYSNSEGVGFKITHESDDETQPGEFPWMVAILRDHGNMNIYWCGGTIIAPNVVLTAAHCVHNFLQTPNRTVVRAGIWDIKNTADISRKQEFRVKEFVLHEQYDRDALYNDLAVLILDGSFEFLPNVQSICLPTREHNFEHKSCIATGWGKDSFKKGSKYQTVLKKIQLPILTKSHCEESLRNTRLGLHFDLDDSFICAGGEKEKDTCKGDGGSPLACLVPGYDDRYYLAGMVSWGIGCGIEHVPGVYINIPYLSTWIKVKLLDRDIDPYHFTIKKNEKFKRI